MRLLLCFVFVIQASCAVAVDNARSLIGMWTSEQTPTVVIQIKQNEDQYKAFLLSGDADVFSSKSRHWGRSQTISNTFSISDYRNFRLPFQGVIQVPDPNSQDGGTKRENIVIPLPSSLDNELLKVSAEDGAVLNFRKTSLFETLIEYVKLVGSTILSFILFAIALIFYAKVLVNRYRAMSSLKIDRRYKELRFKEGKSLKWMLFVLVLGVGVIFVIYHFLLGALGIGGFVDHIVYWTY